MAAMRVIYSRIQSIGKLAGHSERSTQLDPSEFTENMFLFQLFPSWQLIEQNKPSYLEPDPKIMITYQRLKSAFWTKNCFSFLSSLYVDVNTKARTYLWVYQAAIDHYPHLPNFTFSQIKWQNHTKHTASSQRFSNKIPLTAVYPNATPGRIDTFPHKSWNCSDNHPFPPLKVEEHIKNPWPNELEIAAPMAPKFTTSTRTQPGERIVGKVANLQGKTMKNKFWLINHSCILKWRYVGISQMYMIVEKLEQ